MGAIQSQNKAALYFHIHQGYFPAISTSNYANPLSGVTEKKTAIIYCLGHFSIIVTKHHDLSNFKGKHLTGDHGYRG